MKNTRNTILVALIASFALACGTVDNGDSSNNDNGSQNGGGDNGGGDNGGGDNGGGDNGGGDNGGGDNGGGDNGGGDNGGGDNGGGDNGGGDNGGGDGGNTSVADCAGSYSGSFTGDDSGVATAELDPDGVIRLTFTTSTGDLRSEGTVSDTGVVFGEDDGTTVNGQMDFSDCSMAGTWNSFGVLSGTWEAERDGNGGGDNGGGDGGGDNGGGNTGVRSCTQMCGEAPNASTSEGACVSRYMTDQGYDLTQHLECAAIGDSALLCNNCVSNVGISDQDCQDAWALCEE